MGRRAGGRACTRAAGPRRECGCDQPRGRCCQNVRLHDDSFRIRARDPCPASVLRPRDETHMRVARLNVGHAPRRDRAGIGGRRGDPGAPRKGRPARGLPRARERRRGLRSPSRTCRARSRRARSASGGRRFASFRLQQSRRRSSCSRSTRPCLACSRSPGRARRQRGEASSKVSSRVRRSPSGACSWGCSSESSDRARSKA